MTKKRLSRRMAERVQATLFTILGLAILLPTGIAQERATKEAQDDYTEVLNTSRTIGDWQISCEIPKGEKKSCVMTQKVFSGNTGVEVLQANIAKTDDGTLMTLIFPLGIYLPSGAELEVVDHIKQRYEISFCLQNGCFVNQILDQEMVDLLRKKESARININRTAEQMFSVPFSIVGFLDAYKEL